MKRFHVHVNVADLDRSLRFYTTLFGVEPTVRKPEYAKWMLDDPRVNFAISRQGRTPGVDHLGIQTESRQELDQVAARLGAAELPLLPQEATTCCYAKSDKAWSEDPAGVKWESFYTFGEATQYGESSPRGSTAEGACCTPNPAQVQPDGSCCARDPARPGAAACCPG